MEESFGDGRSHLLADGEGTGAFAEDGDIAGIATELRDVALDPLESRGLVHQAVVAGGIVAIFFREFGMREEAEDTEAVIHRDDDNAFLGEVGTVLPRLGSGASDETSAINPDHHGEFVFSFAEFRGRPDIQVETVFAYTRIAEDHVVENPALHAARAEFGGLADAFPLGGRHRWLPAEVADGRFGEGDAEECGDRAVRLALELAGIDLDGGCGTCGVRADRCGHGCYSESKKSNSRFHTETLSHSKLLEKARETIP